MYSLASVIDYHFRVHHYIQRNLTVCVKRNAHLIQNFAKNSHGLLCKKQTYSLHQKKVYTCDNILKDQRGRTKSVLVETVCIQKKRTLLPSGRRKTDFLLEETVEAVLKSPKVTSLCILILCCEDAFILFNHS